MTYTFLTSCHSATQSATSNIQSQYSLADDTLNSQNDNENAELKMVDSTTFNFGVIKAGDTVTHSFHFKNTGNVPLIILSATASCGCTVPHYNKTPILPNQSDSITTVFISKKDGTGFQNKVMTVKYNSLQSPKLLTLYGRLK